MHRERPVLESWNPAASALLLAFFLVTAIATGLYAAHGLQPSPRFILLYYLTLAGLVFYWVHRDRLRRGVSSGLDSGFFFMVAWPVALPSYLITTRGFWRGLAVFIVFVVAFFVAWLISLSVFFAAGGRV